MDHCDSRTKGSLNAHHLRGMFCPACYLMATDLDYYQFQSCLHRELKTRQVNLPLHEIMVTIWPLRWVVFFFRPNGSFKPNLNKEKVCASIDQLVVGLGHYTCTDHACKCENKVKLHLSLVVACISLLLATYTVTIRVNLRSIHSLNFLNHVFWFKRYH